MATVTSTPAAPRAGEQTAISIWWQLTLPTFTLLLALHFHRAGHGAPAA
jgi:hypothetical protein